MTALEDIAAERKRQIEQEGWTVEHDDQHGSGALAAAAACYALVATEDGLDPNDFQYADDGEPLHPKFWPWDTQWWKTSTPRRDLVKAGALIVAEIERLDRVSRGSRGSIDNEEDPVPFPGHAIIFPTDGLGLGCSRCGARAAQLSHPCKTSPDSANSADTLKEGAATIYERGYHGHGQGLVVTQPRPGHFEERPMTLGELAARKPAMQIAADIHHMACYAAFAYIISWDIIAPAIDAAIAGEREQRNKLDAALRGKDAAMSVLFGRLRAAGIDYSDLIP